MLPEWEKLLRLRTTATAPILTASGIQLGVDQYIPSYQVVVLMLVLSFCVIGFAQVFNDIVDRELDAVSKPNRPLVAKTISVKAAATACVLLLVAGLAAAIAVGLIAVVYWGVSSVIGGAYSLWLKGTILFGNIAVAAVSASVYMIPALASVSSWVGWPGLVVIFFFILGNEIFKSSSDRIEDAEFGLRTIATTFGAGLLTWCIAACSAAIVTTLVYSIYQGSVGVLGGSLGLVSIWTPTAISTIVALRNLRADESLSIKAHDIWRWAWAPGAVALFLLSW